MTENLKKFFEENPLAIRAAKTLKNGCQISLVVNSESASTSYMFTKEDGKNLLKEEAASKPDLIFTIPEKSARELVERSFDSVGQVGLFIFEKMLAKEPDIKIKAKLNVGFLSLLSSGYLGVLTAGGADVAKFLAQQGLSNLGKMKETISKMKN